MLRAASSAGSGQARDPRGLQAEVRPRIDGRITALHAPPSFASAGGPSAQGVSGRLAQKRRRPECKRGALAHTGEVPPRAVGCACLEARLTQKRRRPERQRGALTHIDKLSRCARSDAFALPPARASARRGDHPRDDPTPRSARERAYL